VSVKSVNDEAVARWEAGAASPESDASTEALRTRALLFTNSVAVGGMEKHVELLARHLDRSRFEVYAISPEWEPTAAFSAALAAAADHAMCITPDRRYGLRRQIVELARLTRQLRAWRIRVMHMHSTTFRGQSLVLLAARLAGVRTIFVTEHLAPDRPLPVRQRWFRNAFTALVDGVVAVSRKNYEARAAHIYTPERRSHVVNNGVDLDDFAPIAPDMLDGLRRQLRLPAGAPVVGAVVRFEPEKGLEYLIDAMPAIVRACPDAYLLLVGDGSLRADLERQAAGLGLAERVRFAGFQADPRPYLGLIDAFVLPVPVGSMSIGLLEAMAMRRAVVITFGGPGEAVIDGVNGLCAEPRNPDAIAAAVIRLLRDPELRLRYGEEARRRVEDEFSAQGAARHLERLYASR
jgi:glycosyltransferase involved in cell wall biosynthesis